jgi:hypothetical protein
MINLVDNFYEKEDLKTILFESNSVQYYPTYQPRYVNFPNRLKAYPCYESQIYLNENNDVVKIFKDNFEKKTNFKIKELNLRFRKTLSSELKNVFKYRLVPHQDSLQNENEKCNSPDLCGIIYLNSYDLNDGTCMYSFREQIEPDVIIGAKPNRCVFYESNVWHAPSHSEDTEVRLIQPFFIKIHK